MTIHLDDAVWGRLVGPVLVGAYRVETAEFACREVPAPLFQGPAFPRR